MFTVRFASGLTVVYPTANYATRSVNGYTDIYTKKDGVWIAQVPTAEAIIETDSANPSVSFGVKPSAIADEFLRSIEDQNLRRTLSAWTLKRIKSLLGSFDARRQSWRS